MKVKQVFEHYTKWEDWKNGMWRVSDQQIEDMAHEAASILSDPEEYLSAMNRVVSEWIIASRVNLTNYGQNRRAWLGQAACCIQSGIPEHATRFGWNMYMRRDQQDAANGIAESVIERWEQQHLYEVKKCQSGQLVLAF